MLFIPHFAEAPVQNQSLEIAQARRQESWTCTPNQIIRWKQYFDERFLRSANPNAPSVADYTIQLICNEVMGKHIDYLNTRILEEDASAVAQDIAVLVINNLTSKRQNDEYFRKHPEVYDELYAVLFQISFEAILDRMNPGSIDGPSRGGIIGEVPVTYPSLERLAQLAKL